jgi:hypothetical protein
MRIELIGPVLILAVMTTAFLARLPLPGYRPAIAACGGALAFLPVGSTTVGAFILAVVGPASAATIVLCLIYLQSALVGPRKPCLPTRAFLLCLVVTGVVFYPLTFGLTTFDPYDLGYRGGAVPGLMFAYLLIGWVARASDIRLVFRRCIICWTPTDRAICGITCSFRWMRLSRRSAFYFSGRAERATLNQPGKKGRLARSDVDDVRLREPPTHSLRSFIACVAAS